MRGMPSAAIREAARVIQRACAARMLAARACRGRRRANLSRQADPAAGRLRGGRAGRHFGARSRRPVRRGVGQAGDRRERHRRGRQPRDRSRRQGGARRLHAARSPRPPPSSPIRASTRSSLRSGEGLRADHADLLHAEPAGGADRPAGEERGRARRLRARAARQAHLRLGRRRHLAASRGRAVQDHGRHRHPARALSRHRGGDAGPARRAAHHGVRQHLGGAAAGARGQAARARGDVAAPLGRRCPNCRP